MFALFLTLVLSAAPVSSPSAAPSPSYKPVTWQGVALGESLEAVRARFARPPIFVRKVILGESLVEYPMRGTDATLLLTGLEGRVAEIRVEAAAPKQLLAPVSDPFGVNLGDSVFHLIAVRGNPDRSYDEGQGENTSYYGDPSKVRWVYSIRDNVIYAISVQAPKPPPPVRIGPRGTLVLQGTPTPRPRPLVLGGTPKPRPTNGPVASMTPTPAPSQSGAPTPAAGASPSPAALSTESVDGKTVQTAILVKANDQQTGFLYIYRYLESVPCGDGRNSWRVADQEILFENRRNYAKVTTECPVTHERRAWYFDITLWFERGER